MWNERGPNCELLFFIWFFFLFSEHKDLYAAGAVEALVSAIERETVDYELKAVALAALIRLTRALRVFKKRFLNSIFFF